MLIIFENESFNGRELQIREELERRFSQFRFVVAPEITWLERPTVLELQDQEQEVEETIINLDGEEEVITRTIVTKVRAEVPSPVPGVENPDGTFTQYATIEVDPDPPAAFDIENFKSQVIVFANGFQDDDTTFLERREARELRRVLVRALDIPAVQNKIRDIVNS